MKKLLLATVVVAPLVKAASVSKFAVLDPDEYLTIFIVAPPSVLVKLDVKEVLVACAVVRVTEPAVADAKVAFGVPRVDVTPLIDAAERVASLERGVNGPLERTVGEPFRTKV